ncbi:MAG: Ig-like domain-containing protein, partial [Dehalococcoidia bacterium]|nr:Ig-like domain-containing protein [Dehalococcoidia bacterium]
MLVFAPLASYAEGPAAGAVFVPFAALEAEVSGAAGAEQLATPSVTIVAPSAGSTVRGMFQVRATGSGIASATVRVDNGAPVAMRFDRASDGWVASLDSRAYPNGRHALTVVAEGRRRGTVQATVADIQFDNPLPAPASSSGSASAVPTATPSAPRSESTESMPAGSALETGVVVSVFKDALAPGWENWSWGGTARFDTAAPVYHGSRAVSFLNFAGYAGLSLHRSSPVDVSRATHLRFAVRAGARDQHFRVGLLDGAGNQLPRMPNLVDFGGDPIPDGWRLYQIPLTAFGAPVQQVTRVFLQEISGRAQTAVYVDEIAFVSTTIPVVNPTPTFASAPVPWTPSPGPKLYGVNLTGAEYTPSSLPGVLGRDYVYPYSGVRTSLYPGGYQGAAYFAAKGLRLLRVPVRWERLQPV